MAELTDWRRLHGSHFDGARVLVTGGAGFIGSHVVEALAVLGADVVVLDDLSGGHPRNLAHLPPGTVTLLNGSVVDDAALDDAVAGCRDVFHLAAMVSVPASVERPGLYHRVNTDGTFHVLEAARRAGTVRRVMYSASSSAYGDAPELPKHEDMPGLPRSPYAATKLAGEHLVRAWAASYGPDLDAVSLRYFNIFGPRQNANSAYAGVIAAFARTLLGGNRPTITGDGTASRDFTFVHNAVHANLLAARHEARFDGEVFNVASGRSLTITELAVKMAELLGRPGLTPTYAPGRPGDVLHSLADLTRTRATLGYEPIVGFQAGLAATVEWYREMLRS